MVTANEQALPSVNDLDLPFFDYNEPGLAGEVYHQRLAEVRRQGWLARSPLSLVVLDQESGEFFLRARDTAFPGREIADLFGVTGGRLREQIDANILNQTGERHRRLRALVGPAFTLRAAAKWRPVMREFAQRLWDAMGAGECEFVASFAKPYPSLTIAAVLGAPQEDAPRLHEWSTWVQRQFDIRALSTDRTSIEAAVVEVYDYVEALLAGPPDRSTLLGALLAAEADRERLSHVECVNLAVNVLAGAIDTTQSQLSHALNLFAEHPDQWDLLGTTPELVPAAVTEVLRIEPVTPFTARLCLEDIQYQGVAFPAGTLVAICAERANREGKDGERFDITAQRDGRLLTFGAGSHYCLGANLARAELEEALRFLAPRMPGLHLDGPVSFGGIEGIYGIESLPLRWAAVAG